MINTNVIIKAKEYVNDFKFYFCATDVCADAIRAFGLTTSDLPRLVYDDNNNQKKVVQPSDEFEVSAEAIERFFKTSRAS